MSRTVRAGLATLIVGFLMVAAGCDASYSAGDDAKSEPSVTSDQPSVSTTGPGPDQPDPQPAAGTDEDQPVTGATPPKQKKQDKTGTTGQAGFNAAVCPTLIPWEVKAFDLLDQLHTMATSPSAGDDLVPTLDGLAKVTTDAGRNLDKLPFNTGETGKFNDALVKLMKDLSTEATDLSSKAAGPGTPSADVLAAIDQLSQDFPVDFAALGDRFPTVNKAIVDDPACTSAALPDLG